MTALAPQPPLSPQPTSKPEFSDSENSRTSRVASLCLRTCEGYLINFAYPMSGT
jgi:hypothetical protein